jgi:hypothetical protein
MIEPIEQNEQEQPTTPTKPSLVTMQKDSAKISVRPEQVELWEKRGYKVIE